MQIARDILALAFLHLKKPIDEFAILLLDAIKRRAERIQGGGDRSEFRRAADRQAHAAPSSLQLRQAELQRIERRKRVAQEQEHERQEDDRDGEADRRKP